MSRAGSQHETELAHDRDARVEEPPFFKVVLLNDDFTPMDFVVQLLMRFFQKSYDDAYAIMMNIHHKGMGVCGVYTRDIAETKMTLANQFARQHGHPLKCQIERH